MCINARTVLSHQISLAAPKAKLQNDHSRMPLIEKRHYKPATYICSKPRARRVFCFPLGFLAGGLLACFATEEEIVAGGAQKKAAGRKRCGTQENTGEVSVQRFFWLPQVQTLLEHVGPQNLTLPSQTKEHMHDKKFATTFPSKRIDARARSLGPPKGNYFRHNRMGRPSSSLCPRNGDAWLSGKLNTRPFRNPSSPYSLLFLFYPPQARLPPPTTGSPHGAVASKTPPANKKHAVGLSNLGQCPQANKPCLLNPLKRQRT